MLFQCPRRFTTRLISPFCSSIGTGPPQVSLLLFPVCFSQVSFPFLASGYLCLVPHLHDPGSFSSPYACVSLQLLSRSPLRYLQFVRFIRRGLCVHRRSSLSPISFRISVLPPRFRGSVFVARESRRSALTPLPRSGKEHRVMEDYERNRLLVDLHAQPEAIIEEMDQTIRQAISESKEISQVGVRFMRFCAKYDLNRISEQAQLYVEPFNARLQA